MQYFITPIERMILESLRMCPKSNLELFKCTKIKPETLSLALASLIEKELISLNEKKYSLIQCLSEGVKTGLKDQQNIKQEVTDIIAACMELSHLGHSDFKLKKVYLTPDELIVYKGLKYQLESFIKSLKNKKRETSSQTCIFWGEGNYGKIINHYIHN